MKRLRGDDRSRESDFRSDGLRSELTRAAEVPARPRIDGIVARIVDDRRGKRREAQRFGREQPVDQLLFVAARFDVAAHETRPLNLVAHRDADRARQFARHIGAQTLTRVREARSDLLLERRVDECVGGRVEQPRLAERADDAVLVAVLVFG